MKPNPYAKLAAMLVVSFVTMYAVMFFNVDAWDHIMVSLTRTYMALLMVMPMAIAMLLFMWKMYPSKRVNCMIVGGATVVFGASFALLRTQTPITDIQYMRAMIPHHSSAIMTSSHATLRDPETRQLARQIVDSQEREIAQMKSLIQRLESRH